MLQTQDHVYSFISTRSLRQDMMTTTTSAIIVSPQPVTGTQEDIFEVYTNDGYRLFEHKLVQQSCPEGSEREFIRSSNANDLFFGYLCQSNDGKNSTLGLYRFEA